MKLYVVFYNRKTDSYGAPSSAIILIGENQDDAKQRATPLVKAVGSGFWISSVAEATRVTALEKNIEVVSEQADAASAI